ncbi:MAG TPA: hypothetical protein VMF30_04260 [Pirellulales bacterium]|nr:hypothetical protein [Pirellulales bacterium]
MRRNLCYRLVTLLALALLAAAPWSNPLCAANPGGDADAKETDTPQSVVATYRAARAADDWQKCFLCYDERMRANFFSCMLTGVAECDDEELKKIVFKPLADKFDDADRPVYSHHPEPLGTRDLRLYKMLEKRVDLPGLVAAAFRHLDAGEAHDSFFDLGNVLEVRIEGDKAEGYWRREPAQPANEPGQPPAQPNVPIHFRRVDGRWFLTIPDPPPPLADRERAAKLQAEIESLRINLGFSGAADSRANDAKEAVPAKRYHEVRLSVVPLPHPSDRSVYVGELTEGQARRLIEFLSTDGFLRDAAELDRQEVPLRDMSKDCCTLQVFTRNLSLHEDFGWGLPMLKRLDGLRGAVEGEAAQALDAILASFAAERKDWQAAAAAEKPGAPTGDAPNAPDR